MIKIAHRGNYCGKDPSRENSPDYINDALSKGYYVEIDVWNINDEWVLGHDEPIYKIDVSFLKNVNVVCHAKNFNALRAMVDDSEIHCFWHQGDDCTLTSKNWIWTQWDSDISGIKIYDNNEIIAICSDNL
jgi:hypothetical protein